MPEGPFAVQSLELDEFTSDPTSPREGQIWRNVTQGLIKARFGGVTRVAAFFKNGLGIDDAGVGDDYILRYDGTSQMWKVELLGESPTLADVQQLAINETDVSLGTSWQSFASFIFGGTSTWGIVNQVLVLTAMSTAGGRSHSVRVYDVTNGNTIAQATGLSFTTATITDLGAISNLPTGPAVFEAQAVRTGPTFKLDWFTISMKETAA